MQPVRKPTWQQATALVSLSTCGAMTGFAFAHGTVDDMTSPTRMPVKLMALDKPAAPAQAATAGKPVSASESALRSAIVKVASYYLRMAQSKSPAEMQAMIWARDSTDGANHGQSCAAFASLTLALGAQATGQQSWVSGGTTYPWPLHEWADVRVDPNPDSPQVISIVQDARAHGRWHPIGDGYVPQPGDWVLFQGHVEVVTGYSGGVLSTIGGDSAPNLSVNAHRLSNPLSAQGVTGFVNNGELASAAPNDSGGGSAQAEAAGVIAQGDQAQAGNGGAAVPGTATATASGAGQTGGAKARKGASAMVGTAGRAAGAGTQSVGQQGAGTQSAGTRGMVQMPGVLADIAPGHDATAKARTGAQGQARPKARSGSQARQARTGIPVRGSADAGGARAGKGQPAGTAAIPGLQAGGQGASRGSSARAASPKYTRNNAPATAAHVPGTAAQQAFISEVAPGALAAQSRYGVPASVTIAQAIDESGWGQSVLAIRDHNLFGIKGAGPAGTDMLPTQEYQAGQMVSVTAPFRVYHNMAESIADHGHLLATSPSYQQAMANRHLPDAFATNLTGVYATDPQYGSNLIAIMRLYNLYQFDTSAHGGSAGQAPAASLAGGAADGAANGNSGAAGGTATIPGLLHVYAVGPAAGAVAPAAAAGLAAPAMAGVGRVAAGARARRTPARSRPARVAPRQARTVTRPTRYVPQIPRAVTTAFLTDARAPLNRLQPLYEDVASRSGISWELLAACDWMQCQARPRYSPVYGERLGTVNAGGAVYRTKSEALGQCAGELAELAMAVYWIDITARRPLSVRDLARVFAAFRWGGLLKLHRISALEFPYSVQGLTEQHMKMRWPDIDDPHAPDKPGTRFKPPFGAVPAVLCLGYPAIA